MGSSYSQIYADYNATTPCDEEVITAMLPFFVNEFGNASSAHHAFGWLAKDAIDEATSNIVKCLGIDVRELVYTSGSTEGINAVLKGLFFKDGNKKKHIITVKTAHKAMIDVCSYLEQKGASITYLSVNSDGLIDLQELEKTVTDQTLVVAILYGNNETGVIQPLDDISEICKANECLLFADATQALGKLALDNFFTKIDFACFSAHKIYGPKGVGFNYVNQNKAQMLMPFIHGGGQQRSMRGGTYNNPGIVGLSKAVTLAFNNLNEEKERLRRLRNLLAAGITEIESVIVNGGNTDQLPNTLNCSFEYVDGEQLLRSLSKEIAVSNGSACNSAAVNPSHVLTAMGISNSLAMASVRFSLGRYTTENDVESIINSVKKTVVSLRAENIMWERRGV
ncbi:cysteine desulfurase family protein [Spongiivirga sp. MCCC 1A20706]|uniref:cysteine desulfurase family protein n=1 Tax=Spongiivirga sp. MCCC 1A20706 TaxID=3160963 RepID=UPI00397737E5